jgi:hypothetical protein
MMMNFGSKSKALIIAVLVSALAIGPTFFIAHTVNAATSTPPPGKNYNDGVIVGKADCRGGRHYFTDAHTSEWIRGYKDGWKSAGCKLPSSKNYNDGVIVGKADCRGGRHYFTDAHTSEWITGYRDGWKSVGCKLPPR